MGRLRAAVYRAMAISSVAKARVRCSGLARVERRPPRRLPVMAAAVKIPMRAQFSCVVPGDVKSGSILGLLARGCEPTQAAVWGARLHARAGERLASRVGRVGYLARDIPSEVPGILTELES